MPERVGEVFFTTAALENMFVVFVKGSDYLKYDFFFLKWNDNYTINFKVKITYIKNKN